MNLQSALTIRTKLSRTLLCRMEWLVLIALFLVVGAVGHDPWWKRGEAYGFGIIYHFYATHTWLIPVNAGQPFMEKPPLYYWTAELFCNFLGKIISLPDAARFASVLYTSIAAFFIWLTSDTLFAQHTNRKAMATMSATLLLGTYGLVRLSHALTTDIALFAGTAITLYGMALLCTQSPYWKRAALWLGMGMGVAFLSKGFVMPAALGISGIIVWSVLPALHNRTTLKTVLLAACIAAPLFIIWPALVYRESPALFMEWFWDNNIGRFLGFSVAKLGAENNRMHLLGTLPAFAFPTILLAIMHTIAARKEWRRPEYLLPFVISIITMIILFSSASGRTPYLLPLLPGFTLLATPALMRLNARFLRIWNSLARISFSVYALGVWVVWCNLLYPPEDRPLPWLGQYFNDILPLDFVPHGHQITACSIAIIVTILWLISYRFKGDNALNTARIWLTGAILAWCTTYTLLMPWINETRSFRTIVAQMEDFVAHSPYAGECINDYQLGENMSPMLEYFTGRKKPEIPFNFESNSCPLFLTFTPITTPADIDPHWQMIWYGARFLDIKSNELRLYARKK